MILRIFVVWYRLAPFLIAFLRDRRRWILAGPPRFLTDEVHRERARKAQGEDPQLQAFRPKAQAMVVSQYNKILTPASFSPLK